MQARRAKLKTGRCPTCGHNPVGDDSSDALVTRHKARSSAEQVLADEGGALRAITSRQKATRKPNVHGNVPSAWEDEEWQSLYSLVGARYEEALKAAGGLTAVMGRLKGKRARVSLEALSRVFPIGPYLSIH